MLKEPLGTMFNISLAISPEYLAHSKRSLDIPNYHFFTFHP